MSYSSGKTEKILHEWISYGPTIEGVGTNAPGIALVEGSNEVVCLSERQAVFGLLSLPCLHTAQKWVLPWCGGRGRVVHRGGEPAEEAVLPLLCPWAANWLGLQLEWKAPDPLFQWLHPVQSPNC